MMTGSGKERSEDAPADRVLSLALERLEKVATYFYVPKQKFVSKEITDKKISHEQHQ